ncbi:MAG TPA: hypothetical protein PKW18_00110 [Candidatus Sumerlaeota bacterium]|nr:MAG: hypothetical protein BWY12_02504 [candidate division BRC1 bacterium ADurb.Bin183]HOE62686.1 hypothetical protein [Candidatus Sumerlaeota bacterium]HRR29992.1 hypothetical protein [Candidatus Sumerlaeia bacterium]HON49446.1 hypothetical protein [Candidatus Sumerlaeota bacterium]HOR64804.1 hypothetical protein [Candidatus Sumerlaeota bacterium]
MLDRMHILEEKLNSLLERFLALKAESRRMKSQMKTRKGKKDSAEEGAADIEALQQERDALARELEQTQSCNKELQLKIEELENAFQSKTNMDKQTIQVIQSIITRIDALEAEIGELEHEQDH